MLYSFYVLFLQFGGHGPLEIKKSKHSPNKPCTHTRAHTHTDSLKGWDLKDVSVFDDHSTSTIVCSFYHSMYFHMRCHALCFHLDHSMSATVFSPLFECICSSARPTANIQDVNVKGSINIYIIMQYPGGWKKKMVPPSSTLSKISCTWVCSHTQG